MSTFVRSTGRSPATSALRRPIQVAALCLSLILTGAFLAPLSARPAPESFADLAARLTPAVVNISTTQTVGDTAQDIPMPEFPPGSPFEDLFRDFFENQLKRGPQKVRSLGSGFVIDPKGLIVTNNHVIDGADEITVKFADGTEYPATLVGTDGKTDLALLKIKGKEPFPFVSFGDSSQLRVGDWVLAVGNPFGLGGTVTAGIVSARSRDINAGPYDDFIQTDASINRGNSGGPLFNIDGEVVGVNTAIYSPTGGSVGIGFSIPSSIVQGVIEQLKEFGETRRGWLGVHIQTVTPDIAESIGLEHAEGALVASVDETGPAAKGGVQAGDVIVKFDGKDITKMRDLPRIVADTQIGKKVSVDVMRKGKLQTLMVTIDRLDETAEAAEAGSEAPKEPETSQLGVQVSALTSVLRQQFNIPDKVKGVVITNIEFNSDAAEKLVVGDVIVEIADVPVSTPEDVKKRVAELTGKSDKPILLLLNRGGDPIFRSVRPMKKE